MCVPGSTVPRFATAAFPLVLLGTRFPRFYGFGIPEYGFPLWVEDRSVLLRSYRGIRFVVVTRSPVSGFQFLWLPRIGFGSITGNGPVAGPFPDPVSVPVLPDRFGSFGRSVDRSDRRSVGRPFVVLWYPCPCGRSCGRSCCRSVVGLSCGSFCGRSCGRSVGRSVLLAPRRSVLVVGRYFGRS